MLTLDRYRTESVQFSYSNKSINFQYIPGYSRMDRTNFQDISDEVYQASVAIDTLKYFFWALFLRI